MNLGCGHVWHHLSRLNTPFEHHQDIVFTTYIITLSKKHCLSQLHIFWSKLQPFWLRVYLVRLTFHWPFIRHPVFGPLVRCDCPSCRLAQSIKSRLSRRSPLISLVRAPISAPFFAVWWINEAVAVCKASAGLLAAVWTSEWLLEELEPDLLEEQCDLALWGSISSTGPSQRSNTCEVFILYG